MRYVLNVLAEGLRDSRTVFPTVVLIAVLVPSVIGCAAMAISVAVSPLVP